MYIYIYIYIYISACISRALDSLMAHGIAHYHANTQPKCSNASGGTSHTWPWDSICKLILYGKEELIGYA